MAPALTRMLMLDTCVSLLLDVLDDVDGLLYGNRKPSWCFVVVILAIEQRVVPSSPSRCTRGWHIRYWSMVSSLPRQRTEPKKLTANRLPPLTLDTLTRLWEGKKILRNFHFFLFNSTRVCDSSTFMVGDAFEIEDRTFVTRKLSTYVEWDNYKYFYIQLIIISINKMHKRSEIPLCIENLKNLLSIMSSKFIKLSSYKLIKIKSLKVSEFLHNL